MGLFDVIDKIGRDVVVVRGEKIPIRMLFDGESQALSRLFPEPDAPLGPDPWKGSRAPHVPNLQDPDYRKRHGEWERERWKLEVLVATDQVKVLGVTDGEARQELRDGMKRLSGESGAGGFSENEIARVFEAVRNLFDRNAQQRLMDALLVDVSGIPADAMAEPVQVPANFGTTPLFRAFEAAKAFGVPPWRLGEASPQMLAAMMVFVEAEKQIEAAAMKAMGGGGK